MNPSDQDRPEGTDISNAPATDSQPFVGKLVGSPPKSSAAASPEDDGVRVGSPFRVDPPNLVQSAGAEAAPVEAAYADYGPFLYTAMGASLSALLVLFFAAVGAWWFPAGGVVVAVLGTVLSIVGLFAASRFRWTALGCLPLHVGLFFLSYARTLA